MIVVALGLALVFAGFAVGRITSPHRPADTLHYYDGLIDGVERAARSVRRTYDADPSLNVDDVIAALDDVVSNARNERHTAERWTP